MSTPQPLIPNSTPSPTTPYHTFEDNSPLLSITPTTIFLHDGVFRSLQLKTLKEFEQQAKYHDALTISSTDQMEELMAIGLTAAAKSNAGTEGSSNNASSPQSSLTGDLSRKIIRLSTHHVQTIGLHHRYQWSVLERVWRYQRAVAVEKLEKENNDKGSSSALDMDDDGSMQSQDPIASSARLGFKLSLCLLVPMLEMYSHQNQSVALSALQLIFSELSSVPVMSLSQESSNSIEKLEDLLHQWASNPDEEFHVPGPSAMIALACARGTISSFAKAILMLENLDSPLRLLPVAGILRRLNDSRSRGIGKPCGILNDKHVLTWHYDDRLMTDSFHLGKELGTKMHPQLMQLQATPESGPLVPTSVNTAGPPPPPPFPLSGNRQSPNSSGGTTNSEDIQKHFMATDGSYIYVTGPNGKGLSKMGSGLNGTLQGWVYHNKLEINCGFLAYADEYLISRPCDLDKISYPQEKIVLGVTVDKVTLKPDKLILVEGGNKKGANFNSKKNLVTLGLTSDGSLLYLVKAELPPLQQKEASAASEASFLSSSSSVQSPVVQVWLEIFTLSPAPGLSHIKAIPTTSSPVLLSRHEESTSTGHSDRLSPPSNNAPVGGILDDRPGSTSVRRTRSVRITPGSTPPPPPLPPAPPGLLASTSSYDNMNTSLNVSLKQLQMGLYFTCGNYLTIVISTNVHLFLVTAANSPQPPPHGPTTPVFPTYRQFCPVLSPTCTKSLGFHLHANLMKVNAGGSLVITKEDLSNVPQDSSFFHGAVIPEMGATYDPTNNLIWTMNGYFIDCWRNPGHIPPWKQDQVLLLGNTLNSDISLKGKDGQMADVRTVINVMLRHVGIMANHYLLGDRQDANIGFTLDCGAGSESKNGMKSALRTLISLILKYRETFQGSEMTAVFLILEAIVCQLKRERVKEDNELQKGLQDVQIIVLALLNGFEGCNKLKNSTQAYRQASSLFSSAFDLFYSNPKSRNDFFQELYDYIEKDSIDTAVPGGEGSSSGSSCCSISLKVLEEAILQKFTDCLNNPSANFETGLKWILETSWLARIVRSSTIESNSSLMDLSKKPSRKLEELIGISSMQPVASVRTGYVGAVVNFLLRSLTILPQSGRDVMDMSVEIFREVLKAGPVIAESCLEFTGGVDGGLKLAAYNCTEGILKGSLLGQAIPQLLAFLSLDNLSSSRRILDELTEECIQLTVAMSFLANKMNPVSDEVGSDWSSKVQIPSPWNTKKMFDSPHPVRESYKSKETIVIPHARQLYAKFSPQSATQYDYDRLTFNHDSKKVAEFGGNYYGYGNRFFAGPGWARNLIRLAEGNDVAFNFEMKSGREHAVPDKALYGYSFAIFPVMDYSDKQKPERGQDDAESLAPVTNGFSTLSALHCIDVIHNMSQALLGGSDATTEEMWNGPLLESKFLAGLRWSSRQSIGVDPVPRKFGTELVTKLKRTVGVPPLQMRLSIIEKIQAPELEELYLQCCLQHVGPNPYLNLETILSPICESCWSLEPTRDILREIFNLINTLFRSLMAFYEMEKMLSQEIEEISNKSKDINEVFFMDSNFLENPTDLQTLAWICYLDYDKENPMNLINDVIAMVNALSADGGSPTLTRTDELIEETHLKCRYLLSATPSQNIFGQVYPTQKVLMERLHSIHGFLSSHMQNPQSTMVSFFEALRTRRERAGDRIKGLDILHKILECSSPSTSSLIVASTLLQNGPRLSSILCSGLEPEVLRIFGEVMKIIVRIAEKNPLLHRYSIALLSVTAYDKTDEENLVESGLVGLLDQLCAFQTGHLTPLYQRSSPTDNTGTVTAIPREGPSFPETVQIHNKASTLAWAAFQVLAGQCASWERSIKHVHHLKHGINSGKEIEEYNSSDWDEPEHRELPLQISINITNHLARAAALAALSSSGVIIPIGQIYDRTANCSPSLSVAIQDVLDLLNNLRKYKIGRTILKQSPCICRLLGLLQDPRLSPRLVLTILQLLHTALPLVDDLDTAHFRQIVPKNRTMPSTSGSKGISQQQQLHAATIASFWTVIESTPYTQVGSMLLSKLADYLVCGSNKTAASDPSKVTCFQHEGGSSLSTSQGLTDPTVERMEVWLHKSNEQQNQTVSLIRQLFVDLARQDLRPTRGTLNELESELNLAGKVLLYLDESSVAERKALRISQFGHLVTLLPAGWSRTPYHIPLTITGGTRGGGNNAIICKEKNSHLASWDPARPFLSGHVAENLSSEIVQLVRALLSSSSTSGKWGSQGALDAVSQCGSHANVQSGDSTTSVSSMAGAASICTGGDTESLASDVIAAPSSQKGNPAWPGAMEQVICAAMKLLPKLLSIPNPITAHIESYVYSARLIIAALTVLGGFTETIRAGLEVWIVEEESERESMSQAYSFLQENDAAAERWEYSATRARVISVSETCPMAKVEIIQNPINLVTKKETKNSKSLSIADIITVPLSRLVPGHFTKCGSPNLPDLSRFAQKELAGFLKTLLVHPGPTVVAPASSKGAASKGNGSSPSQAEYPLKRALPTLSQIVSSVSSSGGESNNSQPISDSKQIAQSMTIVRLLAEIRTKSMQVLSLWLLRKKEFSDIFLGIGSESHFSTKRFTSEVQQATESLKELCKLCIPSHKPSSLESQVAWMRILYRDCTKPPRLPITSDKLFPGAAGHISEGMRWDLSRQFPKIKSAVFSSLSNSLVYTGDYNVSGGNPRGLLLFGNRVIPVEGFYWEATIVTMEDPGQHADLIIVPPLSIGFSPVPASSTAPSSNDVWKYPNGTVMYTTLGRVIHYKSQDPGSWVTVRLDDDNSFRVRAGDTIGVGWEKVELSTSGQGHSPVTPRVQVLRQTARNASISLLDSMVTQSTRGGRRARHLARSFNQINLDNSAGGTTNNSSFGVRGQVYLTLNGRRLPSTVEQSNCSLHPILHVQKKQMVVHTNLGERPFLYSEANKKAKQPQAQRQTRGRAQSSVLDYQRQNATGGRVATVEANTGPSNADVLLRRVSDSLQDLNIVFDSEWDDPAHPLPPRGIGSGSTLSDRSTRRGGEDDDDLGLGIEDEEEWGALDLDEDADDDEDDDDSDDPDNAPEASVLSDTLLASARNRATAGLGIGRGTFRLLPPASASGASTSSMTVRSPRNRRPQQPRPSTAKKRNMPASSHEGGAETTNSWNNFKKENELFAKSPQKTSEYNPVKSLEYFVGHSPTAGIKVFQGPRRYVCPCAAHCPTPLDFLLLEGKQDRRDVDSLDSYEDDEDDDIHSLLVKAWETKVFPVIRRRFRNESERRDGLEQIRGALQLGMLDIARQTVEFLYEEGGGLPRDLHFPTLEEVRAEAVRCTMDKLKPGMNVIIRPIQQEDLGLLPPYAVSAMLRTFGLTAEVLEVDQANELVLLETYIESEGILVRFWYPVSSLDKSQTSKKPTLSANTVNMFKLHSNLIGMEGSLANLYSRQCYLAICQHEKNRASNLDLESIQILSDNCLANYPPSRDLFTYNLQCESPSLRFLQDCGNPSVLFYRRDHDFNLISAKLRQKIKQASSGSSEDNLTIEKLTGTLLSCLELPARFPKLDVPLDRIHDVEVVAPGMAFTLMSFKSSAISQMSNKHMASVDNTVHPCLHLSAYDSGELSRHVVACYPLEPLQVVMHRASSSAGGNEDGTSPQIISHTAPTTAGGSGSSAAAGIHKTIRKRHGRFPPVMVPTDRIHCSISELNLNDVICEVQGIPKEFPLAILYLQELVTEFHENSDPTASSSLPFAHVTEVLTRLMDFLDQHPICPVVKDWMFNLIAEFTRVKSSETHMSWKPSPNDKLTKSCTPNRLFLELLLLHDKETTEQGLPLHFTPIFNALNENMSSSGSSPFGGRGKFAPSTLMFHISSFISGHQKPVRHLLPAGVSSGQPNFSFYFNSLNDLCLALNEVSEVMVNPFEIIPCAPATPAPTAVSSDPSPIGSPQGGPSTTDSGHAFSGAAAGSSQSKKTSPRHTLTAKRMTKPFSSQRDVRNPRDVKKIGNVPIGQGTSGGGTTPAEKSTPKPILPGGTPSEDGMVAFAKASEVEWFNNQVIISRALKDIVWHSPNESQNVEATQVLIGAVLDKLKTPQIHSHLLVIQGAPVNIDGMSIEASLIRALRGCGGIHGNEMWISGNSAVVEIRSLAKVNEAYDMLKQNKVWYPLEDYVLYPNVTVCKVNEQLRVYSPSAPGPSSPSPGPVAANSSQQGDEGDQVLHKFLRNKLSDPEVPDKLSFKAREVLTNIFMSCYAVSIPFIMEENGESEEALFQTGEEAERTKVLTLSEEQIRLKLPGNLFDLFATGLKGPTEVENTLKEMFQKFGEKTTVSKFPPVVNLEEVKVADSSSKKESKDCKSGCRLTKDEQATAHDEGPQKLEELMPATASPASGIGLSLQGFLSWCTKLMKTEVNTLWKALIAAGYDIRLDRVWVSHDPPFINSYFHSPDKWSIEKDVALISYIDQFSQSLHIDPTRIQPVELYMTESDFLNPAFTSLQGADIAYLRVRWGMFQKINNLVGKKLLPHVSLHHAKSSKRSVAKLLHDSRQLLLYFIKDAYLYKIIQISATRGGDTPTPEITLDPVSSIGNQDDAVLKHQLSQIIQQMGTITTAFYCVPPAQGADPALPISVKFQGEEVLGLSGSFRHFLLNAAKELQSDTVRLLSRCPSADAGRNKDSFIISPGKLSYGEEDFLHFLGQLIGISIRADAPLALPLLRATWRSLLLSEKELNDSSDDLIETDVLCATYLNKLESFGTKLAFDNFLSLNAWPKFQYPSMDNKSIVPLCSEGSSISVGFSNREEFIKLIKQLRVKELHSQNRVAKILTGLATILPLPAMLGLFTSDHLELRIAGSPEVNLSLLKSHTHYQVGVNENDPHVMYFWATLESFTPEELKKFVKFAANLERLPVTCPCQSLPDPRHPQQDSPTSNNNAVHVPPFPMKIAPIDLPPSATVEEIDKRLIRVETCLFLIRLPPYSSLQVTRQQLLFAINCREDPLSG